MMNRGPLAMRLVIVRGSLETCALRPVLSAGRHRRVLFADRWPRSALDVVEALTVGKPAGGVGSPRLLCIGVPRTPCRWSGASASTCDQDAVAAANVLWKKDFSGALSRPTARVSDPRTGFQVAVQNILRRAGDEALTPPLAVRCLRYRSATHPARMVGGRRGPTRSPAALPPLLLKRS
jgi:hypothetical protein